MEKVAKIKTGANLKKSIAQTLDSIGGLKQFINQGETVLLKPNFNTADPPPASSDPEFIKAVVELIYEQGAKIVMVGGSSTMSLNTRKTMQELGIFDLEKMEKPPRVYVFEDRDWIKKEIAGAKYLKKVSLTEFLDKADKVILLPCLKTHSYAQFTGALKLSVGFMKPFERVSLHLKNLQEKIAELNKLINPSLVIMDARKCFISGGPSKGEMREPGLILASESRLALDLEGIKIIQEFSGNSLENINPLEISQIKRALEINIK